MKKKKESSLLVFSAAVLSLLQLGGAVNVEVGFGQSTDTAREGEEKNLFVRLSPEAQSVSISGCVIPFMTYLDFQNSDYADRTVSSEVQAALESIGDNPEVTDIVMDPVNYTITAGSLQVTIDMEEVILVDEIHEAKEDFILVINVTDDGGLELTFDDHGGVIVFTILDNNPIFLVINSSTTSFSESHGPINNIRVERSNYDNVSSEVDLPVNVVISNGTTTAGEDYTFPGTNNIVTYTIGKNDSSVLINPITITDDDVPETEEYFRITIPESDEEDLNIFPLAPDDTIDITIEDDDVAEVVFTETMYTVTEGDEAYVEVCITLANGVSLNSSSANGTFNISTSMGTAEGEAAEEGKDYEPTPSPINVTLERGQDTACSNITIINNVVVEANVQFNVSVINVTDTFSEGVKIVQDMAIVVIEDDDGAVVGFTEITYEDTEGDILSVCVNISSPNTTILNVSDVHGTFNISSSNDIDLSIIGDTKFELNSVNYSKCFDVNLTDDSLIEGNESVVLTLIELENERDFGIRLLEPNSTDLTIIDNDAVTVGFRNETYTASEDESNVLICIDLTDGDIAEGVNVTYSLLFQPDAELVDQVDIDSMEGYFSSTKSESCHNISITQDPVAEIINQDILLRIQQVSHNSIVSVDTTTITIMDDDVVMISMTISPNRIDEGTTAVITVSYDPGVVSIHPGRTIRGTIDLSETTALGEVTATAVDDYRFNQSETFTLSSMISTFVVGVVAINDDVFEYPVETLTAELSMIQSDVMYNTAGTPQTITIRDIDTYQLSFEMKTYKFGEDAGDSQSLYVNNTGGTTLTSGVTINLAFTVIESDTNATGLDYHLDGPEPLFRGTDTQFLFYFDVFEDELVEGNEVIAIRLSIDSITPESFTNDDRITINRDLTVTVITIEDDDVIVVGFNVSNSDSSGVEGENVKVCIQIFQGVLAPNVTLSYLIGAPREQTSQPPLVDLPADTAIASASASSNNTGDYVRTAFRVSLDKDHTSACTTIYLIDDEIVENRENFSIQVEQIVSSDDLRFPLHPEYFNVTIIDNDEIKMGFEQTMYTFNENTTMNITVRRENEVTVFKPFNLEINLLSSSNATEGTDSDFSVEGGFPVTLEFNGNDESQSFSITFESDFISEGPETIELEIVSDMQIDGVIPGENQTTTIVIADDDFIEYQYNETSYSVKEGNALKICVSVTLPDNVTFADDGNLTLQFFTSPITADYTSDYEETPREEMITLNDTMIDDECIYLIVLEDNLVEGREYFELYFETFAELGSFSVSGGNSTIITILDIDVALIGFNASEYSVVEGEGVTFCVTVLEGVLNDVVYLNYSLSSSPGTAAVDEDYSPLIEPSEGTLSSDQLEMCHNMTTNEDEEVEPPENISIIITPTDPTAEFIGIFNVTRNESTVLIIDNDAVTIGFERNSYTVREDGGSVDVCLRFRGPLKNDSSVELSINIISDNSNDHEMVPVPQTLRLDTNDTLECVTIDITDDMNLEGTETFQVHFTETDDNEIMIFMEDTVPVFILDDEEVEFFLGESYTVEEGGQVEITVQILNFTDLIIENDITFKIVDISGNATRGNGEDYVFDHGDDFLTIPVGNDTVNFTLNATDDFLVEGTEETVIRLSEIDFVGIEPSNVIMPLSNASIFIIDDDEATIGFSSTIYTTPEDIATVCVNLTNGTLQDNVVIRYSTVVMETATSSSEDFEPYNETGEITSQMPYYCHEITITDDDLVEPLENLTAILNEEYNVALANLSPDTTTITIDDTDSVSVGFESAVYAYPEDGGFTNFMITLIREDDLQAVRDFSVWVSINLAASNATVGGDFAFQGGAQLPVEVAFDKSDQRKNISLRTGMDEVGEGDELVVFVIETEGEGLMNEIKVTSRDNTTAVTIIENDFIDVDFSSPRYEADEGETTVICVEIDGTNMVLLPSGATTDILVTTMSSESMASIDYQSEVVPSRGLLNETINTTCFIFTSLEDELVEGTEDVDVSFSFANKFGSFAGRESNAVVAIVDDDYFEIGFEQTAYTIGEEEEEVNDVIHIVKMKDNTLLKDYNFTITVHHSIGPYPAKRGEDFEVLVSTVYFRDSDTRIPIPVFLLDDPLEEGFENFTLEISVTGGPDETVQIVVASTMIHIKDDDVVVIGFENSAYVVFEGQTTEVCVSILDRTLLNDDHRNFTITTDEVDRDKAIEFTDFVGILGQTTFISRGTNISRRCFDLVTTDDEESEPPEKFTMIGTPISHFIEFNPDSTLVWIIDDDSLLLPVPEISSLNCSQSRDGTILTVTCTPSATAAKVAELVCSVDGEPLKPCSSLPSGSGRKKRVTDPHVVVVDLMEYVDGLHVLEIIGLTQFTELLRDTVQFFGLAQPFTLDCVVETTLSGFIDVSCTTTRVLDSLICTVDEETPQICALNFILDPSDYDQGRHSVVVTGTNLMNEVKQFNFTFESSDPEEISVWDDREFVAVVAIAGVAFIILVLLMFAICLLIFYHRKVSTLRKYGYDLRAPENDYVGIDRNLSFREQDDPVELVDYTHYPPSLQSPSRSVGQPASRSSSSAAARAVRPVSEASTVVVGSSAATATTFHVPPPPVTPKATAPPVAPPAAVAIGQPSQSETEETSTDERSPPSQENPSLAELATEEEKLLLAAASGGEGRGLKISRRHSVEVDKKPKSRKPPAAALDEIDSGRHASFSGGRAGKKSGGGVSGAYSVPQGKEIQTKEWEAALQKEFDDERAQEKENVRARERRREQEQRERRRAREQASRDQRAEARRERERERDAARDRRLTGDSRSPGTSSPVIVESPESFL